MVPYTYLLMQYKKQRENFVKETNRKKGSLFDLPSFQFIMNWLKVYFVSSYFCIQIHNFIYSTKKGEGKKGKLSKIQNSDSFLR